MQAELTICLTQCGENLSAPSQAMLQAAFNSLQLNLYAEAADNFIALLNIDRCSITTNLVARFYEANCLLKALLQGEYDAAYSKTATVAERHTQSILKQAEDLLLDFTAETPMTNRVAVCLLLAKIQRMQARYQIALDTLQSGLQLEKSAAKLLFECAQLYDMLGGITQAHDYFKRAIAADPLNKMIMRRYSSFLNYRRLISISPPFVAKTDRKTFKPIDPYKGSH